MVEGIPPINPKPHFSKCYFLVSNSTSRKKKKKGA
jgi:hypothetical protein